MDNLFWSEEHVSEWLEDHPEYRDIQQVPIQGFWDELKNQKNR